MEDSAGNVARGTGHITHVSENLLASFAHVKRCGDKCRQGSRASAREEAVKEGWRIKVVEMALAGRGPVWQTVQVRALARFNEIVLDLFIPPPIEAREGHIAPHGKRQSSPQRAVTLRLSHVVKTL